MVLARAVATSKGLTRTVLRRVGSTTRTRTWRQVSRRGYASGSGHGEQQSSEIPWIIGSLAVTVPAAGYLLQQGTKKGDHGHEEHDEHEKEEGEEQEEQEQPQEEESDDKESKDKESKDEESKDDESEDKESKDEESDKESEDQDAKAEKSKDSKPTEDESKEDGNDDGSKDEDKGDEKQEDKDDDTKDKSDDSEKKKGGDQAKMSEDGFELPGPNAPKQINWDSSSSKGPGEGQKGQRKPSEKKGDKDSASDFSGAKHPYIDDAEKSKKGVGVTETAKIHGTVDPRAPARGPKGSGAAAA